VARGAAHVLGIDASPAMVDLAAHAVQGPVEFRVHDLAAPLPWLEDGSFDAAVMALVIHHLDDGGADDGEILEFRGRSDLTGEAAWLARIARAYMGSPTTS
jgi:hypothetical protein